MATGPVVAVHLRRGDAKGMEYRLTGDDWYFRAVAAIRKQVPDASVHIFSSTEGVYKASDFDGYRARNMTVHLDADVLSDWAWMSSAQVLVIAKSSYSHVPAWLNPNCVVFQPYWNLPLSSWVNGAEVGSPSFDVELAKCIR
mmetsp:Transcript_119475/g.381170  ORF Transcript_119475/g.381170 Transcript_119475/m.381170 type:complete len:142 (+) Transcript_119475:508-933(+)